MAHAEHDAPPAPQEPFDSEANGSHAPLAVQQPFGHDVASQTHWPLTLHSSPGAHAMHTTPPAPHEAFVSPDSASHVPPLQHPAHDAPPQEHDPFVHAWPVAQALHAAPPVPHSELTCEE